MKIKRFEAPDMRTALRRVQAELGAEAVILSTENRANQVCVIAALDYDAGLVPSGLDKPPSTAAPRQPSPAAPSQSEPKTAAPGHTEAASPSGLLTDEICADPAEAPAQDSPAIRRLEREMAELHRLLENRLPKLPPAARSVEQGLLHEIGIETSLLRQIYAATAVDPGASESEYAAALAELARRLPVKLPAGSKVKAIALVGPTGAGKTTTAAKLGARHLMRHPDAKVRFACTDSFRIGAKEQLQIYARLLGAQVEMVDSPAALQALVDEAGPKDLIIIDTPGIGPRDTDIAAQLPMLAQIRGLHVALCLPAPLHPKEMRRVLERYSTAELDGVVLTKLDESQQLGTALSLVIEADLPVLWITDGQRVPQDLHRLNASALVARALAQRQRSTERSEAPAPAAAMARTAASAAAFLREAAHA